MCRSFTSVSFVTPDHVGVMMLIQTERRSSVINYVSPLERTTNSIVRTARPTLS
jgi:hypothetical protein